MKKNYILSSWALLILLSFGTLFSACKKENDDDPSPVIPGNPLIKLGSTYASGAAARVELYAEKQAGTGYNVVYVALYDSVSGQKITDSHIHLEPHMDMGSMSHGAPAENPEQLAANGLFPGAVIFTMAGTWELHIHVHNHLNNQEGEGHMEMMVADKGTAMMNSFDHNSQHYLATLLTQNGNKIGLNNFEVVIHREDSNGEYIALENLNVEIEPVMPSMGHGSPNNVNPTHSGKGHYQGKVNFTMSGLWRVKMLIKEGTTVLSNSNTYFDITL